MTLSESDRRHDTAHPLMRDLEKLCDMGGRLSGSESEARALDWLRGVGATAMGVPCKEHEVSYRGWRARQAKLSTEGGEQLDCHPLVRSLPTSRGGLDAEVVNVGRGLEEDFKQHRDLLRGRIVLFQHEAMFSSGTFHRRRKLHLAREAGAVGALVASTIRGEVVTGSSRGEGEPGIPAMGITPEAAERLSPEGDRRARARMMIDADEFPAKSSTLVFDLPGMTDKWIVLSAHVDGHDLAESAMDNASGVAVCLEVARRIKQAGPHRHGLRMAFFSVEEWGLTGSDQYLNSLPSGELEAMLLNINLDTVVGGAGWTALTSGFPGLSEYVREKAASAGFEVGIHETLQRNSDHANFAIRGIPAFRLLSGFDEPQSDVRFVLTGQDLRCHVRPEHMVRAAYLSTALTQEALQIDETTVRGWRRER